MVNPNEPSERNSGKNDPGQAENATLTERTLAVIRSQFHGVLVTLDHHGFPHTRVMGAATMDHGLRQLVCLSARQTRKLEHIRRDPRVTWTFFDPDTHEQVLMKGLAQVVAWPERTAAIWEHLLRCAPERSWERLSEQPNSEFQGIVTNILEIEYLEPSKSDHQPKRIRFGSLKDWAQHVSHDEAERTEEAG